MAFAIKGGGHQFKFDLLFAVSPMIRVSSGIKDKNKSSSFLKTGKLHLIQFPISFGRQLNNFAQCSGSENLNFQKLQL